jgi:indolepyruvate ferredoxin oxidoreductase beta subunit
VTAAEAFVNIPDYPDLSAIHAAIRALPLNRLVAAEVLARKRGSPRR